MKNKDTVVKTVLCCPPFCRMTFISVLSSGHFRLHRVQGWGWAGVAGFANILNKSRKDHKQGKNRKQRKWTTDSAFNFHLKIIAGPNKKEWNTYKTNEEVQLLNTDRHLCYLSFIHLGAISVLITSGHVCRHRSGGVGGVGLVREDFKYLLEGGVCKHPEIKLAFLNSKVNDKYIKV